MNCVGHQYSVVHGLVTQSVPYRTLTSAFYARAEHLGSRENAIWDFSESAEGDKLTYKDLALRAQGLARYLQERGVRPGQTIPLISKGGIGFIVGILAVLTCGAQYLPIHYETQNVRNIQEAVSLSQQDLVLCDPEIIHEDLWYPLPNRIQLIRLLSEYAGPSSLIHNNATEESICFRIFPFGKEPHFRPLIISLSKSLFFFLKKREVTVRHRERQGDQHEA